MPFHLRDRIANGIFNSVLTYCLPVFGGCDKGELDALQVMQNCAARYVSQLSLSTNRKVIFRQIRWLTVRQLIHYHTALSMFRIRRSQEPEYLSELISRENRHNNLIIPNTNLTLAKKSFCFRGPEEWNKLPAEIRDCERIGTFNLKVLDNYKWVSLW